MRCRWGASTPDYVTYHDREWGRVVRGERLLYERFGFTVAGVRRAYYTKPVEDALVLWRDDLPRADRGS